MLSPRAAFLAPLKTRIGELVPLLILAPTTRCGSTLLQRAINQGGEALIYGENFLLMETAPALLCSEAIDEVHAKARAVRATLDRFRSGDKGMDGSALFPDYLAYRRMLVATLYRLAAFYREESARCGYALWGLKHQIRNLDGFRRFVEFIPDFRAVTIYRDVLPVATSIATRWPEQLASLSQCGETGRRWQRNLDYLLALDPARNLVLRYEDLVADPDAHIPRIASHLGVALSRAAFDRRVNTHGFDPQTGRPLERYVPPQPLPMEKQQAVLREAEPLYTRLGYSAESAG